MVDVLREVVLPKLDRVRKSGGGFMSQCPAHDDGTASLSISAGEKQPVVFHCHAGCEPDVILERLNLTWEDLSNPKDRPVLAEGEWTPNGTAVAVYDYRDETGNLLFQVLRTKDKQFLQRMPDATTKTGWRWKLGDTRRVLYRLSTVIEAVNGGRHVWICEGEKDVHTLINLGLVATCNPGGAGKWRPEYNEFFREAVVTIVADRDKPGQDHARQVAAALAEVAAYVDIVEAAQGKDATDHLNAGHDVAEFVQTWCSEEPIKVDLAPDLWEFIGAEDEPYDWIVPGLLERGDRLMLTGFEGLGKTMLTRQLAVTIAAGLHPFTFEETTPRRVLVIDCENSERQSRRKYRALAAASVKYQRRVPDGALRLIHRPEGIDLTRGDDAAWLIERVTAHKPDVLVIGPFYRLHVGNMNDELPARKTISILDQARTRANCALILEAHAGHGEQGKNRSVRPTGSSLLLRWPEFGYGISPGDNPPLGQPCRIVDVQPWRGPRDERDWPVALAWATKPNDWPWQIAPGAFGP